MPAGVALGVGLGVGCCTMMVRWISLKQITAATIGEQEKNRGYAKKAETHWLELPWFTITFYTMRAE